MVVVRGGGGPGDVATTSRAGAHSVHTPEGCADDAAQVLRRASARPHLRSPRDAQDDALGDRCFSPSAYTSGRPLVFYLCRRPFRVNGGTQIQRAKGCVSGPQGPLWRESGQSIVPSE